MYVVATSRVAMDASDNVFLFWNALKVAKSKSVPVDDLLVSLLAEREEESAMVNQSRGARSRQNTCLKNNPKRNLLGSTAYPYGDFSKNLSKQVLLICYSTIHTIVYTYIHVFIPKGPCQKVLVLVESSTLMEKSLTPTVAINRSS